MAGAQIRVDYHTNVANNLPSAPQYQGEQINRVPIEEVDSSGEIFLEKGARTSICIEKEDFHPEQVTVQLIEEFYEDGSTRIIWEKSHEDIRWIQGADYQYYSYIDFLEEGHFRMVISYGSPKIENIYTSPLITIDETEPKVDKFSVLSEEEANLGGISVYKGSASYELILQEENFHPESFSWKGLSKGLESFIKMSPWESYYENGSRKNRTIITVEIPGISHLAWEYSDSGGRHKVKGNLDISIDNSIPVLAISSDKNQLCKDPGYQDIQYFSQKPVSFQLTAQDKESGIKAIEYSIWSEGKKIEEVYLENSKLSEAFSVSIPLKDKDFCGWISAKAINGVDKYSQLQTSEVFLWESSKTADYYAKMQLSVPTADFRDTHKNISYYKGDVTLTLNFEQPFAGVKDCNFMMEEDGQWKLLGSNDFSSYIESGKNQQLQLKAKDHTNTSETNPIHIKGKCSDNAGYVWYSDEQFIVIDQKPPRINVEYHTDTETRYRNKKQYATVMVEDLNFNENSVEWKIEGDSDGYQIGEWQGKGKKHYCKVTFLKDGSYRLGLQVSDYAKNKSSWVDDNTFILDEDPPQIKLWMDDQDAHHEKYYKTLKKMYIFIKEDNFYQGGIEIRNHGKPMTFSLEKEDRVLKGIPKLFKEKDWKIYSILLQEDGSYDLSFGCTDVAGNVARRQMYPSFVIDRSKPMIKVMDLSDGITFTDQISAKILVEDKNLIANECKLTAFFENGKRAEFMDNYVDREITKDGSVCFTVHDLPHEKSMDNRYRLKIEGKDLAGNDMDGENTLTFYVDRYGARYDISEETKAYIDKYYVRESEDLLVKAFSLHPLETDILVTKDNESFRTLSLKEKEYDTSAIRLDGEDRENKVLPFHHKGWYQTTYHISKKVFNEEGSYRIILRSRERSSGLHGEVLTESENRLWTQSIEFLVDKTPPTVVFGGLNDDRYDNTDLQFTITAIDNTRLKKVRIHFEKNNNKYIETYRDYLGEEFNENHSITGKIMEWEGSQSIWYEAWDYAGNHMTLGRDHPARKIVVAKNFMTRAYYIHPVKMALCILGIFIVIPALFILTRKHFFAIVKSVDSGNKE